MIQQSHSWAYISRKTCFERYMHPNFIAVLSTVTKTWKQPKCSLQEKWIKIDTYTHWNAIQPKKDKICHFHQHGWMRNYHTK